MKHSSSRAMLCCRTRATRYFSTAWRPPCSFTSQSFPNRCASCTSPPTPCRPQQNTLLHKLQKSCRSSLRTFCRTPRQRTFMKWSWPPPASPAVLWPGPVIFTLPRRTSSPVISAATCPCTMCLPGSKRISSHPFSRWIFAPSRQT